MKMLLAEWQAMVKPVDDLIRAASTIDVVDGLSSCSIGLAPFLWTVDDARIAEPSPPSSERGELLYVNFDPNTDQRRRGHEPVNRAAILRTLVDKAGFAPQMGNVSALEYWGTLRNSVFVASPEGNGVDCHRTYEALVCGCIPVVETRHRAHIELVYGKQMPILYTADFTDIRPAYLARELARMQTQTFDFSRLFVSRLSPREAQMVRWRSKHWRAQTASGTRAPPGLWNQQRNLNSGTMKVAAADRKKK